MKLSDIRRKIDEYTGRIWTIAFVKGDMGTVMEDNKLKLDVVKLPNDRMYADPFILDVTDDEILVLVEDMPHVSCKGYISLLHINRATKRVISRKVILELPTHLSFPAILRKDGHVYIYPESSQSGKLELYEYHPETESVSYARTICDDKVWDSYMTDVFGEPLLFTASHDDTILDIYKWDKKKERYIPYTQVLSDKANSRLGGAVFEYKGEYYYPAQDSTKVYGGAIDIKKLKVEGGEWKVEIVKHIKSTSSRWPIGLHTLNEYKGVVVVDVKGFQYGIWGAFVFKVDTIRKKIKHRIKHHIL